MRYPPYWLNATAFQRNTSATCGAKHEWRMGRDNTILYRPQHKESEMEHLFLSKGSHVDREDGMCAMEFAAYLAGLEHTDSPACVSRVLLALMIRFNDLMDP